MLARTMDDAEFDLVLSVLAHSGRRRMLDILTESPGMSVKGLASHFVISRVAVLKDVQLLERAGLVISKKEGLTYAAFWCSRMADVQTCVEARAERKVRKSARRRADRARRCGMKLPAHRVGSRLKKDN